MIGPAYPVVNPDGPPLTHADSARDRLAAPRARCRRRTRSARSCQSRVRVARARADRRGDSRRRQGVRPAHDERLAGAISPFPQIVDRQRRLRAVRAAGAARRARRDRGRHHEHVHAATRSSSATPSPRFAAAKSRTKSCCSARISTRGISATGGTDNGTGAIAVLEAARILKAAGVQPKRTIRFVLFTRRGRRAVRLAGIRERHEKELDKHSGGARARQRHGSHHRDGAAGARRAARHVEVDAAAGGAARAARSCVRAIKTGTDHLSFMPYGVPAFNYDQLTRGYDHTHHSQIDDYNHTVPSDVAQAATIMAVNAWQFADHRRTVAARAENPIARRGLSWLGARGAHCPATWQCCRYCLAALPPARALDTRPARLATICFAALLSARVSSCRAHLLSSERAAPSAR